MIAEVKRNKKKVNIEKLKVKAEKLLKSYKNYDVQFLALSLDEESIRNPVLTIVI